MKFYYIYPNQLYNFDLFDIYESAKTKDELVSTIRKTAHFCRESESIDTSTLIQFIKDASTITIYSMENEELTGAINFSIKKEPGTSANKKYVHINALCVPERKSGLGLGKKLITKIILFSKEYNFNKIKLICSGGVFNFYKKLGFNIENVSKGYDSDDSSDSDIEKYNMVLDVDVFYFDSDSDSDRESESRLSDELTKSGGKSRKIRKYRKIRKTRKSAKYRKRKIRTMTKRK